MKLPKISRWALGYPSAQGGWFMSRRGGRADDEGRRRPGNSGSAHLPTGDGCLSGAWKFAFFVLIAIIVISLLG